MATAKPKKSPKTKEEEDEDLLTFVFVFLDDKRRKYRLTLDDVTTREQVETEEFFDRPFAELIDSGWLLSSVKGMIWLAYLTRRRTDPTFTYEEALDNFDTTVEDDRKRPTEVSKETGNPG